MLVPVSGCWITSAYLCSEWMSCTHRGKRIKSMLQAKFLEVNSNQSASSCPLCSFDLKLKQGFLLDAMSSKNFFVYTIFIYQLLWEPLLGWNLAETNWTYFYFNIELHWVYITNSVCCRGKWRFFFSTQLHAILVSFHVIIIGKKSQRKLDVVMQRIVARRLF